MINVIRRARQRRRLRRLIAQTDYAHAMHAMRMLASAGSTDRRLMLYAVERAIEVAPDDFSKKHAERFAGPLRAGRLIKIKGGGELVSVDGVPVELIDLIESAFEDQPRDEQGRFVEQ